MRSRPAPVDGIIEREVPSNRYGIFTLYSPNPISSEAQESHINNVLTKVQDILAQDRGKCEAY